MKEERHTDPQGRSVRTMHCAYRVSVNDDGKPEQQYLWDFIHTASHEHIVLSFHARRSEVAGVVQSLKNDIESYNQNHLRKDRKPVNMTFDFDRKVSAESAA
jgi:hypothetical protein